MDDEQARQQFVRSFKEHPVLVGMPVARMDMRDQVLLERTNKLLPCLLVMGGFREDCVFMLFQLACLHGSAPTCLG